MMTDFYSRVLACYQSTFLIAGSEITERNFEGYEELCQELCEQDPKAIFADLQVTGDQEVAAIWNSWLNGCCDPIKQEERAIFLTRDGRVKTRVWELPRVKPVHWSYVRRAYRGNITIFDMNWMRKITRQFVDYLTRFLIRKGYRERLGTPDRFEQRRIFYKQIGEDPKNVHTVELVGLKGDSLIFDVLIDGTQRPEMTMNPMRRNQVDQGVPLSMIDPRFSGFLSPGEARLYVSNWRAMLLWFHDHLDPIRPNVMIAPSAAPPVNPNTVLHEPPPDKRHV